MVHGSDLHSAAAFAERLREKIAETTVTVGERTLGITVSIGIAAIKAQRHEQGNSRQEK